LLFPIASSFAAEPADQTAKFLRGLNLNGPAVTIDGHIWEGGDSTNYECRDKAFAAQHIALIPSTDAQRATMIRSSRWGGNKIVLKNLPDGALTLFVYVWEDNNSEKFSARIDGKLVSNGIISGEQGHWQRLGPWQATANNGNVTITTQGGAANFSGIEIWSGVHDGVTEPIISADELAFFENKIRPLLAKHCYECHASTSEDLQADLLVDSRPTLLRGGASGPAIIPGDVDHSLLIKAVRYEDGLDMPPDEPLSAAEIADLEKWIRSGAADPRNDATRYVRKKIDVEKAREFWSLRPISDPQVPDKIADKWCVNEIDAFLLDRLHEKGLPVNDDADRNTLIRRATFDLLGLPPRPDEVDSFVNDDSEKAYERLIDRLLDSPHYGERWGRHWMDLVRYADTAGDNSDYPVPTAYLYRDYIIASFNNDKPYDQFIREQIAGDLLPADSEEIRNEQTIATGYLAIARRFGSLKNDYPQHLTIEDTLDNIGRTMLGMTLSCARCHDHKFDPISQDDYYGLYGIFQSTQYPFPGIELDKKPTDFVPLIKDGKPTETLAYAVAEGQAGDAHLHVRGEPKQPGDLIARRFPEVLGGQMLSNDQAHGSGRLQLATWLSDASNPLTARVIVNRIWQYHFGSGLVSTPSDFGVRGLPPTHPELLDWLASRFIEDGWSIKHMHRRIMLSHAYRISSLANHSSKGQPSAQATDPANVLHWRFNRTRLDAESLRDTLLMLSGELDINPPTGPHPFPPADKWEYTQHHPFRDSYDTDHRTVYMMTARLNSRPFFTTFDGADRNASTSQRDRSVTTVQSLYLLNNEFVHGRAEAFATRLLREAEQTDERLRLAFRYVYARQPTVSEMAGSRQWIDQMMAQLRTDKMSDDECSQATWAAFARVLFRTNEFLYVD
jgi:hypothetical protein